MRNPPTLSFTPCRREPARARQAGFTMLEILVVLAILGLLIGVLITNVGGNLDRGQQDTARIYVTASLRSPLTSYRIDIGDYPTTAEGLNALIAAPAGKESRWRGPYIEGGKLSNDPWGEPFQYRYPGTKNVGGYDLFSKGPDRTPDTADDIGNW